MSTLSKEQLHKLWDALNAVNHELFRLNAADDPLEEKLDHLYTEVDDLLDEIDERLGGE